MAFASGPADSEHRGKKPALGVGICFHHEMPQSHHDMIDSTSLNSVTSYTSDISSFDVAARVIEFKAQARSVGLDASSAESTINLIPQRSQRLMTSEEWETQQVTVERLRKRARILRQLEAIYLRKASQLENGSESDIVQTLEAENSMMRSVNNMYLSDLGLKTLVDISYGRMNHWQKVFQLTGLLTLIRHKEKEAEDMRLRQMEMTLNGMALDGNGGMQNQADRVADLLAGLSV